MSDDNKIEMYREILRAKLVAMGCDTSLADHFTINDCSMSGLRLKTVHAFEAFIGPSIDKCLVWIKLADYDLDGNYQIGSCGSLTGNFWKM